MNHKSTKRRIVTQFSAVLIAVVLLSVTAVGLSSIWFLKDQFDQQAWSQIEQGQRAAIALHSAQYREILNLATLTGQRPILRALLAEGDTPALTDYLNTLKDGADLTRIILCNPQGEIIATTDDGIPESICTEWKTGNYQYNAKIPQACLTAHQPITDQNGGILGEVFVCNQLDNDFAREISQETGLEHTIWIDNLPVSTSFDLSVNELAQDPHTVVIQEGRTSHHKFEIDGVLYYSAHLPLEANGLSAEVALDVSEIRHKNDWSTRTLILIILGVAFMGSLIGILAVSALSSDESAKNTDVE